MNETANTPLPEKARELISAGRLLNPDEVAYLDAYIPQLESFGLLDEDEKNNIKAYIDCIDLLAGTSKSFLYDYNVNYINVLDQMLKEQHAAEGAQEQK